MLFKVQHMMSSYRPVLTAICHMTPAYVNWPSLCDKHMCAGVFARWTGIDNVIGAIDGCHIR